MEGEAGGIVDEEFEVGTGGAGGLSYRAVEVEIFGGWSVGQAELQDGVTAGAIGGGDVVVAVEAAGSKERGIEAGHEVGGPDDEDSPVAGPLQLSE